MDLKDFQWTRRRTREVASIEIIETVVASTPNLVEIVAILHSAA
jgi:hypothetical protein